MPRPRNVFVPGLSLHVYQRGANKATMFRDEVDYRQFLAIAERASHENDLDVHGYVVMSTHFHLIATPQSKNSLPAAMHDINGEYSKYYNRRYQRIGPAWNGRYGRKHLRDERYWLSCLRYVEYNPVKAALVATPEAYEWSSYRVHAFGESSNWLVPHSLYLSLGSTPAERQTLYRAICACGT